MTDVVGWVATAVFACRQAQTLRRIQVLAALLWLAYGVLMKAPPVIVANAIVASLALASSCRRDFPPPTLDAAPPERFSR